MLASSGVLSFALLGDALLYAVLPVHAEAFGVSLVWVGILLSANRFVRVFAYGWLAQLTEWLGMRTMCTLAALGAVASTSLYGLGEGAALLLLSRVLWGLVYAVLVLVTLAYAVEVRAQAGVRVGWSRAVQRTGPIVALVTGTWLTATVGPREIFLWLALGTLPALALARSLPRDTHRNRAPRRPPALGRPTPVDALFFLQGLGVDGVFALTITLVLAQDHDVATAVFSGGLLLALRHGGEVVAAPLFGAIGDRFGAARVFAVATALTALGFAGVAAGHTVPGAIVLLVFRGALASLGPASVVQAAHRAEPVMLPLARMQAWRDLGAAVGPLLTGYALASVSGAWLHGLIAICLGVALGWFQLSFRREGRVES